MNRLMARKSKNKAITWTDDNETYEGTIERAAGPFIWVRTDESTLIRLQIEPTKNIVVEKGVGLKGEVQNAMSVVIKEPVIQLSAGEIFDSKVVIS